MKWFTDLWKRGLDDNLMTALTTLRKCVCSELSCWNVATWRSRADVEEPMTYACNLHKTDQHTIPVTGTYDDEDRGG